MKKVLVTGGAGYIGSHTVLELIGAGYEPVILDNFSNSSPFIITQLEELSGRSLTVAQIDLRDEEAVRTFVAANTDIHDVIHFAAFKAVGQSVEKPLSYYHNNIHGLINLLRAFEGRAINFVFSSSCTVYGEVSHLPVRETEEVKAAASPYGETKIMAEHILKDVAKADPNLKVISLRYFNPVGAHASGKIGELPIGAPQNLFPVITQTAIGKRAKVTVFGQDYDTPDGTAMRDYIHVVDLAKAHIQALRFMDEKANDVSFNVYNIGTGNGYTILEVITAFERETGVKLPYDMGGRRSGDVPKIYGDAGLAERELLWKAELGLKEMIVSAWAWETYLAEKAKSGATGAA